MTLHYIVESKDLRYLIKASGIALKDDGTVLFYAAEESRSTTVFAVKKWDTIYLSDDKGNINTEYIRRLSDERPEETVSVQDKPKLPHDNSEETERGVEGL